MENLCAYDSSSSSADNDESPKNKKRKVSSTEVDRGSSRGSKLIFRLREDKLLKPSMNRSNARGAHAANLSALKQIPPCSASNYQSGLSDCFSGFYFLWMGNAKPIFADLP